MTLHSISPLSHSQMLRMWAEPATHRPPVWRFSLEDVATGERTGFADLDELIGHLLELMETPATNPLHPNPLLPQPGVGQMKVKLSRDFHTE